MPRRPAPACSSEEVHSFRVPQTPTANDPTGPRSLPPTRFLGLPLDRGRSISQNAAASHTGRMRDGGENRKSPPGHSAPTRSQRALPPPRALPLFHTTHGRLLTRTPPNGPLGTRQPPARIDTGAPSHCGRGGPRHTSPARFPLTHHRGKGNLPPCTPLTTTLRWERRTAFAEVQSGPPRRAVHRRGRSLQSHKNTPRAPQKRGGTTQE